MPRASGSLRMSIITRFLDGASAMMSVKSCAYHHGSSGALICACDRVFEQARQSQGCVYHIRKGILQVCTANDTGMDRRAMDALGTKVEPLQKRCKHLRPQRRPLRRVGERGAVICQVIIDDDVEVVVREKAHDPQEASVHGIIGHLLVAHAVRRARGARRGHLRKIGQFWEQAHKVHVPRVNTAAWQLAQQALWCCRCVTAFSCCQT